MYLMLSWLTGQPPSLELLPVSDTVQTLKLLTRAAQDGREIELYTAQNGDLTRIYPSADVAFVSEAGLIPK